jgi:hypothetical protein
MNAMIKVIFPYADPDYYVFGGEEEIFTAYIYKTLKNIGPNTPLSIFPIEYNVAWRGLFPSFANNPDRICIFHWDGMPKPWALNDSNINEILPFCYKSDDKDASFVLKDFKGTTLKISFPPTLEGKNIAFVIPEESGAEHYFLSLFTTPEEGRALLKCHFPCLLENPPAGKTPTVPTKEMMFFLDQVLSWKKIAAGTGFY